MNILILGLGQDGKCAVKYCESNNIEYRVILRRSESNSRFIELNKLNRNNFIYDADINLSFLLKLNKIWKFNAIINFAANSYVQSSDLNYWVYLNSNTKILCELVSYLEMYPETILFHPLSSEILGNKHTCESELENRVEARNAYGLSKISDYWICKIAVNNGLKINYCVVFNHESIYRPKKFFTSKLLNYLITKPDYDLSIYNALSVRDWGYAPEYMEFIFSAIIKGKIGETMLGTSFSLSVKNFINLSLDCLKIDYEFSSNHSGLFFWEVDGFKIIEKSRDVKDQERIVISDRERVLNDFESLPKFYGKYLIEKLIEDFKH